MCLGIQECLDDTLGAEFECLIRNFKKLYRIHTHLESARGS